MLLLPFSFLALVTAVVAIVLKRYRKKQWGLPLPPGPKKYPIIGNLLDLPSEFEWIKYREWSKQYGSDLIHLDAAGSSIVVVNSIEAANDLFEKRSSIYSSRPRFTMINELMGWTWLFAFMPYSESWKHHRRLFQQEFHPTASMRYQPQELKYTRRMLRRLLKTPEKFMDHMRHTTGAIIMDIGYAIDVLPEDDPYIYIAEKALYGLVEAAVPGTFLVDSIPLLKYTPDWMPGASFKKKAKEWRCFAERMIREPFEVVKKDMVNDAKPCFTAHCLENMDSTKDIGYQERIIRQTAGNLYAAGSDTTVSALNTFMLAMLCYPEVQSKAQREIDDLLSGVRLPEFEDEDNLPYIMAIVKEVIRWQPVTPIAIPHYVTEDDEYNGYRIPANSTVVGNAWAILHDERMYPDPFTFKPERWLTVDGKLNPNIRDPNSVFGFGRRMCPGRHMAYSSLWITAASVLATFNITKAKDDAGNIIEPDQKYHSALICHALPFKCTIRPRDQAAEELILSIPL